MLPDTTANSKIRASFVRFQISFRSELYVSHEPLERASRREYRA
jgi:hypothetical protein